MNYRPKRKRQLVQKHEIYFKWKVTGQEVAAAQMRHKAHALRCSEALEEDYAHKGKEHRPKEHWLQERMPPLPYFPPLLSARCYYGQTKEKRVLAKGQGTPETHEGPRGCEKSRARGHPTVLFKPAAGCPRGSGALDVLKGQILIQRYSFQKTCNFSVSEILACRSLK